jgi:hypothetical protein
MPPRTLASIAAFVGLAFGGLGVVATVPLAAVFGITLDDTGLLVARLACASYLGFGVLNAMARGVTDPVAWRAIAAGNGIGWGVGAVIMVLGMLGVLGGSAAYVSDARAWLIPAMQIAFAALWLLAFTGTGRLMGRAASSPA